MAALKPGASVNWDAVEFKNALKVVIKIEIQSLMERLSETGEETVLLTATTDGQAGHIASIKSQRFAAGYNLKDVKIEFLKYCLGSVRQQNLAQAGSKTSTPATAGNQKKEVPPVAREGHVTEHVTIKKEPEDEEYGDVPLKKGEHGGDVDAGTEPPMKRQKQTHPQQGAEFKPPLQPPIRPALGQDRLGAPGERGLGGSEKLMGPVRTSAGRSGTTGMKVYKTEKFSQDIKKPIPQSLLSKQQQHLRQQHQQQRQQQMHPKGMPMQDDAGKMDGPYPKGGPGHGGPVRRRLEHEQEYSDEEDDPEGEYSEDMEDYSDEDLPEDYPMEPNPRYSGKMKGARYGHSVEDIEYFSNSSAEEEYYNSLADEEEYDEKYPPRPIQPPVSQGQYNRSPAAVQPKIPPGKRLDSKLPEKLIKNAPEGPSAGRVSQPMYKPTEQQVGLTSRSANARLEAPAEKQLRKEPMGKAVPVGRAELSQKSQPPSSFPSTASSLQSSHSTSAKVLYAKPAPVSKPTPSTHPPQGRPKQAQGGTPTLTEAQIEALLRKHGAMNEEFIHLSDSEKEYDSEEEYRGRGPGHRHRDAQRGQEPGMHMDGDSGSSPTASESPNVHLKYDTRTNEFKEIKGSSAFQLPEDSHHERYKPNSGRNQPKSKPGQRSKLTSKSPGRRMRDSDEDSDPQKFLEDSEEEQEEQGDFQVQTSAGSATKLQLADKNDGQVGQSKLDKSASDTDDNEEGKEGSRPSDNKGELQECEGDEDEHADGSRQEVENETQKDNGSQEVHGSSQTSQDKESKEQEEKGLAQKKDGVMVKGQGPSGTGEEMRASVERKMASQPRSSPVPGSRGQESMFRSPARRQGAPEASPSRPGVKGSELPFKGIHTVDLEQMSQELDIKQELYDEDYEEGERIEFGEQEQQHLQELEKELKTHSQGSGFVGKDPENKSREAQEEMYRQYNRYEDEDEEEPYDEDYEGEGMEDGEEYEDYGMGEGEKGEMPMHGPGMGMGGVYHGDQGGRGGPNTSAERQFLPAGQGVRQEHQGGIQIKQETFDPEYMQPSAGHLGQSQQFYPPQTQQQQPLTQTMPENFVEAGEFMAKCLICDKIVRRETMVKHNFTHIHGAKPFQCDICGKSFIQESRMLKHRQIHFEEKKQIVCPICQKEFSSKTAFQRHVKRLHPGEPLPGEEPVVKQEAPSPDNSQPTSQ